MRFLLNVIWLIFGGLLMALAYFILGVVFCVLIITIPFGVASFRLAGFALWPFGRTIVPKESKGIGSAIGNILWIVLAGWWLALLHIVWAVAEFITIIGIPLAIADLKLVPAALFPLGHQVVPSRDIRVRDAS